jgi:hypothetical protein
MGDKEVCCRVTMFFSHAQKRGQIFLIGAMLFILIIIGLTAVGNFVIPGSPDYDFEFVAENIKSEMVRVVEYDIKNSEDKLGDFINLTSIYLQKSYPGANFSFIYGDSSNITIIKYFGETNRSVVDDSGTNLTVQLNGEDYFAEFYPSRQVYFAIEKREGDNVFVGFA